MRIVFLGCTKFSEALLLSLINIKNIKIVGVFSIPKQFNISYSEKKVENTNYADLSIYANQFNIPHYIVDSVEGMRINDYQKEIALLKPDVILVMGWYYMVPQSIRKIATYGAWGIHASLLPNYAGGAPLVWAMINGETETGVTLFRLDDGVDDGDIIEQQTIQINNKDTIKEVYEKATVASKVILKKVFDPTYQLQFKPQDKSKLRIYPQRKPEDGIIDWTKSTKEIKDFIRAQTKPYPGAYTIINGKKVTIWDADIIDL
ncbi:MAG: methionyl-tRNA formyltransferase [Bacteroidia bacterium]